MKRLPVPATIALLLATTPAMGGDAAASNAAPRHALQPIHRIVTRDGKERFAGEEQLKLPRSDSRSEGVAFVAVVSRDWPEGLVPMFGVEKGGRFELRRRPLKGQENYTEPLFFALPAADEGESAKVAGRWLCSATHADGSKHHPVLELTIEDGSIAGRFDQNTEYRFAFIAGGSFRTNRIELTVEHVMDRYTLSGEWRDARLTGTWRRSDDDANGTWEGSRPASAVALPKAETAVPLYQWRRADGELRYAIESEPAGPGWERSPKPLCRVWRK